MMIYVDNAIMKRIVIYHSHAGSSVEYFHFSTNRGTFKAFNYNWQSSDQSSHLEIVYYRL